MKKLLLFTLICVALAGLGNVFSKTFSREGSTPPSSEWAMFKELFQ